MGQGKLKLLGIFPIVLFLFFFLVGGGFSVCLFFVVNL